MKRKVRLPLVLSMALMCFMSGCYISFNRPDEEMEPKIETEPGRITAEYYLHFGQIIAADADHVLVCSNKLIHIFKHSSSGIELIQTIGFEWNYRISSMTVYRSELFFGITDSDGIGTVYVYSRHGDVWELSQKITKGRSSDRFGSAIDIDGETMVIGANSYSSDCLTAEACEGWVFVFKKRDGVWEETQELKPDQTETGSWFGTCVGIYGNLVLAGSPEQPLHLYQLNEDWELLRTEEIYVRAIAHSENNFMVSGDEEIRAFILEADGSFSENTINVVKQFIGWSGEIIEMRDNLALVDRERAGCYLLKYGDRQWNVEEVLSPDPGEHCTFHGMAITDHYAIIGGENYEAPDNGYVYFRDL